MIGFVTQKDELTLAEVSFMGKEVNMSSGVNSTGQTYALDMQKVSKRFPGTLAVDKVDFRVKKGEVHALMGENGAGKSTLMKMLNGLFNDYTGDIYINGEKKLLHSPTMAKEAGIGMVYQELSLARRISIYENLLVGRLPKKGIFVDKKKAIEESKKLLAKEWDWIILIRLWMFLKSASAKHSLSRLRKLLALIHPLLLWMSPHPLFPATRLNAFTRSSVS